MSRRVRKFISAMLVLSMCASSALSCVASAQAAPAETPEPELTVTLDESDNGKLAFPDTEETVLAFETDETVTVKAVPDEGFQLESIELKDTATGEGLPAMLAENDKPDAAAEVPQDAPENTKESASAVPSSEDNAVKSEEASEDAIMITAGEDGTFSFAMPTSSVTICAVFTEYDEESGEEPSISVKDGTKEQEDAAPAEDEGNGDVSVMSLPGDYGIMPAALSFGASSITRGSAKLRYGYGIGDSTHWSTYYFYSNVNGQNNLAYCVEPTKDSPNNGEVIGDVREVTTNAPVNSSTYSREQIRTVMYFCYGSPGFNRSMFPGSWWPTNGKDASNSDTDNLYIVSHLLLSWVYNGGNAGIALNSTSGQFQSWFQSTMIPVLNNMLSKSSEVPASFRPYIIVNPDLSEDQQNLISWLKEPNGWVKLSKSSANTVFTDGNNCYSLEGAVYGVYSDAGCGNRVGTLTTNASGETNTVELREGQYYVKEITAPKGYAIDGTVYPVYIYSDQTSTVSVKDKPLHDPAAIEIEKVDKETGKPTSPGGYPLEGAQFTIKYYAGSYTADTLPEEPTRTWVIESKGEQVEDDPEPGQTTTHYVSELSDYFKVDGDEFYLDDNGEPTLPLGTITVEETKAPEGYKLEGKYLMPKDGGDEDKEEGVYLREIKQEGNEANLIGGNELIAADQMMRGDIHFSKVLKGAQTALQEVPFKITNLETGESHTVKTDGNGYYSSEASYASHLTNTNGGEKNNGTWFGGTEPDDTLGAFPYGTYTIEELPCEATAGMFMYKDTFLVTHDMFSFNIGTIENSNVGITTTARDEASQTHYAFADDQVTIIDRIEHVGLEENKTYTVKGTLMLKSLGTPLLNDGKPITAEKEYTPKETHGSLEMEFTFDATGLEGEDVVVYEEVYDENGELVVEHKDLHDEDQTVNFPGIGTSAADSDTKAELSKADSEAIIVDTVSYKNLQVGRKYTLEGSLVDQSTGRVVRDDYGDPITAKTSFTPDRQNGKATVTFTFDATGYDGRTFVIYEKLIHSERTYATHEDINDTGQTIHFPRISTQAKDSDTQVQVSRADDDMTIIDSVIYQNLTPKKTYTLLGTLMDKSTGAPALDDNGEQIKAQASFVAEASEGRQEVTFHFSGKCLENKDVVVFEELLWNGKSIAEHKEIKDEGQTVSIPKIRTSVLDSDTNAKVSFSDDSITVNDTVSYWNLIPGQKYKLEGKLMDKDTGAAVKDAKGADVTASAEFTPDEKDGQTQVTFRFDGSSFHGVTGVVFENLLMDGKSVAIHEDMADEEQTEYFPDIHTSVSDSDSKINSSFADDKITVTDTVSYTHLLPGKTYAIDGVLMDKSTGEKALDADGRPIMKTVSFEAEEESGEVEVTFTFNGTGLENHTFVVYETLYLSAIKDSNKVAEHKNLNDEAQSDHIPEIGTSVKDSETNLRVSHADDSITVVDTVTYKNLVTDLEYKMTGILMDKETGEPALDDDGNQIKAEATFTPEEPDGTVDVTFTFSGEDLAGSTFVAYETMYYGKVVLAEHKDIKDKGQTFYIPEIHTTAVDSDTEDHISFADGSVTIEDTVDYTDLLPDVEYRLKGTLMDKATGQPLLDEKGAQITAETVFTPKKSEGSEVVTFKFSAKGVNPKNSVAFEQLLVNGHLVAEHEDISDEGQSVELPKIHTKAIDSESKINASFADKEITVTDTVTYKNLLPGKTYVLNGVLMDQATGDKAIDGAGKEIKGTATFKADSENGEAKVTFVFDGTGLENHTFVVFESLYLNEVKDKNIVAEHKDINDEAQSIHIPEIGTTVVDNETNLRVSHADNEITVIDTVEYKNLIPGKEYKMSGILMDKDTGEPAKDDAGNKITGEAVFTPDKAEGTVDVTFTFSGAKLAGNTFVSYETMTYNDVTLAEHKDIKDEDQTFYIPAIHTTAIDSETKDHIAYADGSVTVTDTVKFTDLLPGVEYVLKGVFKDKATGNTVIGSDGKEVMAEASFIPKDTTGSEEVTFTFNAEGLNPDKIVAFEYLYVNGILVAEHEKIDDEDQSIELPKIGTKALDSESKINASFADDEITVTDTVTYKNLLPGRTYVLKGIMMDKATGEEARDGAGKAVIGETTFEAEAEDGTAEVTFVFDGTGLENHTFVVFESMYLNSADNEGNLVADHKDIDDEAQSIHIPRIGTSVIDTETNLRLSHADDAITVVDTVKYENLIPNLEYEMTGILMDKHTGEPAKDDFGGEITGYAVFTPEAAEGTVDITFTFSGAKLAGNTFVSYETMTYNNVTLAVHKDLKDEGQTFYIPEIHTTATDSATEDHISYADDSVTVIDRVEYTDLLPGIEYTMKGTLMNKETGEVLIDADGREVTAETVFTPDSSEGSVDVTFTFNASGINPKSTTAFEQLHTQGFLVAEHEDIDDEEQGIELPRIRTKAVDSESKINASFADGEVTVKDTVSYENLIPDKKYVLSGVMMDKATGKEAKDGAGKSITASATFTPKSASGEEVITFTFSGTGLENRTYVVFESMYIGSEKPNNLVADHRDINDEAQSIHLPEIGTAVVDDETGLRVSAGDDNIVITDTVEYKNLVPGYQYRMEGILMDKDTGKEALDDYRAKIKAETFFTPEEADGSVEVQFVISGEHLTGSTLVAFETLTYNGVTLAEHKDIKDEAQTVYVPQIRTTALDSDTKDHISYADDSVTIVDTVKYTDLLPDVEYRMAGKLMDKSTGEAFLDADGNEVVAESVFTPSTTDGSVDVVFTFNGKDLTLKTMVAFEELSVNGIVLTTHSDIEDKDQSIQTPEIRTRALDDDTALPISYAGKEVKITDTVIYRNLLPGKSYTLSGTFMDKETGKVVLDAEGNKVTAEAEFTPETKDGTVTVHFTFDGRLLAPAEIVAFEELYLETEDGSKIVADHRDIEDASQTITVPKIATQAIDGETGTKMSLADEKIVIVDKIMYENLLPGYQYEMKGSLVDKATGDIILDDNGKEVVAEGKFTAEEPDGETEVTFTFSGKTLAGMELVAFEDVYLNGKLVASHHDIDDQDQLTMIPDLKTFAHDNATNTQQSATGREVTITDHIEYEDLVPGQKYVVRGTLYDVDSLDSTSQDKVLHSGDIGGDVSDEDKDQLEGLKGVVDAKGNPVEWEMEFIPESSSGSVDVEFSFNAEGMDGKTFVLNERIYLEAEDGEEYLVAVDNLSDEDQRIYFPVIRTTASDTDDGDKEIQTDENISITDVVEYQNLVPGTEYRMSGTLMDKETNTAIMVNGAPVTAETVFTPEEANGSVNVVFTFDGRAYEGKELVAFEKLFLAEEEISQHEDISDVSQTVHMNLIPKPAVNTKTGDNDLLLYMSLLTCLLMASGAVLLVRRKKRY